MCGDMLNMMISAANINPTSQESEDKQRNARQENHEKEARTWQKRYATSRLNTRLQQANMALDNSLRLDALPVALRNQERGASVPAENKAGHAAHAPAMHSIIMRDRGLSGMEATSATDKGRMHKRTDPGNDTMNDMPNIQHSHIQNNMPSPPDAAVTAGTQDDVHDYAALSDDLAAMAGDDGVFELIFPGGQTMGVVVTSQPSRTNFLLTPSSSALGSWLRQQRMELASHLETRIQKTVNITVL